MKTNLLTALISLSVAASAFAQSTEKKVALRNNAETPPTHATMVPKGALNISSTQIGDRQVFTLIDANGGELADGDDVQLKIGEGKEANYWYEIGEKIERTARPADKASTHFKIRKTGNGISLQAPSGKFVTTASKTAPVTVTDAAEKALVFEVVENPVVASSPTPAPAAASPSPAAEAKE